MSATQEKHPKHLVVYTHVSHHVQVDQIVAHAGFVLEIDIWARIFEAVTVVAPFSHRLPKSDAIPYNEPNITCHSMGTARELDGIRGKLILLFLSLNWLRKGATALTSDSIIMARGPGSPGMLGAILAIIYRLPRFAKYADQLNSYSGETIGTRVQRAFLKSKLFGGPVLVYGEHDPQKPHLVPVNLPLSISRHEWEVAGETIKDRTEPPPFKFLFAGRLSTFKSVDLLIRAVRILLDEDFDIHLDILGDGETRMNLERLTQKLSLVERISFHGWVSRQDVFSFYKDAFCLVNCSKRQGIDKVLIEAMTYALPIVSPEVNMVQMILEPPRCGLTYAIDDLDGLVDQLRTLLENPSLAHQMGQEGRIKTEHMQTDQLETMYREFLRTQLSISC